ncbi:MAG TPA: type VI secretion system baseplate subunit TssK [Candidatus Acidoferrum sp.]|nr:type VI secretion system baseplate subunit TssK [Candidatus Acidoferrum sp.]
MKHLSKVVWYEGMYLGPHHFQVQTQSFEDLVNFATASLSFAPYGFLSCKVDAEALQNGNLSLVHARGVFPDGLLFQMPDADPLPPVRAIAEIFPPTRESLVAYLAVPPRRSDGPNCALEPEQEQSQVRYIAEEKVLPDENSGKDEKPVSLGRKNIRFVLDVEEKEEFVLLPVARILRDSNGNLILDPSFIPPCLMISASERLLQITRTLVDILEDKSASLAMSRRGSAQARAGYSTEDVAAFWFVHTINASLSVLRHLYMSERGHPEHLFVELSRLAGALCSFGLDSHPQSLPVYDHDNLEGCFSALDAHIRKHLELVVPSNCIVIPLVQSGRNFRYGEVTDQRCLDRARWILALRADMGEADLIAKGPRLIKVCSKDLLPDLVKTALSGLPLAHLPVPPSAIAPKVEFQYFGLSRVGSCWEHIVTTRGVGIYTPDELPNVEIELLVALDS